MNYVEMDYIDLVNALNVNVANLFPYYDIACECVANHGTLTQQQTEWAISAGIIIQKYRTSKLHNHNVYVKQTLHELLKRSDYLLKITTDVWYK